MNETTDDWLAPESAPTDGTEILGLVTGNRNDPDRAVATVVTMTEDRGWWSTFDDEGRHPHLTLLGWRPLPAGDVRPRPR